MRTVKTLAAVVGLALVLLACGDDGGSESSVAVGAVVPGPDGLRTIRTGGNGTAFDATERAYSLTSRNINHYERQVFADGKVIFEVDWTPVGPQGFGGLGPNFDATACSSCHLDDGRSPGPAADGVLPMGLTVKLLTDDPAAINEFGAVLSARSEDGPGEAVTSVRYEEVVGEFDDGTPYTLRRPVYSVDLTGEGSLPADAVIGIRVAPQLPGMGLLELIPDSELAALADPDDLDGDGISGRLGTATDLLRDEPAVGRFGWTAGQPTVEQQSATALFHDMGLTSRYFPTADCDAWAPCVRVGMPLSTEYNVEEYGDPNFGVQEPAGGEVTDEQLLDLAIYTQTLAVPAPRDLGDPEVERGYELFGTTGCTSCHAGPFTTREGPIQGLSNQVIQPYTDLLLHDLGLGLGDQSLDGTPVPTEWRTPPLWGIGLLDTVSGHTTLLHDGRARGYEEAILWHDGEAAASAAAYRALSAADRAALVRFLESL
ncbi:MAG: di-heme oxidoredictase family protein [Acidimicrobiales bacterium]